MIGMLVRNGVVKQIGFEECNHIEEFIALVYTPGEELHDFPPREVILGQKTSCEDSHYLDSM